MITQFDEDQGLKFEHFCQVYQEGIYEYLKRKTRYPACYIQFKHTGHLHLATISFLKDCS